MATITFTSHLRQHVECTPQQVSAATVAEALAAVFRENRQLEGYIIDEQDRLRKHVSIFVDGVMIRDRVRLSDSLKSDSQVHVLQALSGG